MVGMNYQQQLETKLVPGQEVFGATYIRDLEPKTYKCGIKCRVVECRCACGKVFPILLRTLLIPHQHLCNDCQHKVHRKKTSQIVGSEFSFIPNQKFSHLTYLEEHCIRQTSVGQKFRIVRCRCDCGNIVDIAAATLMIPRFHACRECIDGRRKIPQTDLRTQHPRLWSIYQGMRYRCLYAKAGSRTYKAYRGRGISICDEWRNSFDTFVEWALSHGYDSKLSIDRINVNGNYEPSNCRWADAKMQANNQRPKRSCLYSKIHGEILDLKTASEKYHIPYGRIYWRYTQGYRGDVLVADKIVVNQGALLKKNHGYLI